MNNKPEVRNNFLFLSGLLERPVVDSTESRKLGELADLAVLVKELYPKVAGLVVRKDRRHKFYLPWERVEHLAEDRILVKNSLAVPFDSSFRFQEGELLLREDFLDKQIVDVFGSKLERVNDIHLLKENSALWVVHMDVGFKGVLRRLGWEKAVDKFHYWTFSFHLPDRFVSWKYVQPVISVKTNGLSPVKLTVSQARLGELHPADLADMLLNLGTQERRTLFSSLEAQTAAEALSELPTKIKVELLEAVTREQMASILNLMPPDETADFLNELNERTVNSLLSLMDKNESAKVKDLLRHPAKTAGALMNTDFFAVIKEISLGEAFVQFKQVCKDIENFRYIYVKDEKGVLTGVVTLKQLLTEDPLKVVQEVMKRRVIRVKEETDQRRVIQLFMKYNFFALPVTDKHNFLKGIITFRDALKAVYPEFE